MTDTKTDRHPGKPWRASAVWRVIAVLLGVSVVASACTALIDRDATQCSSDGDCAPLGEGYLCGADGLCSGGSSGRECNSCHGSDDNPAPPRSTTGETDTAVLAVGAHQTHLHDNEVRDAMWCQECHLVPTTIDAPTHRDGLPAEITFGVLSQSGGAGAQWDHEAAKCSQVYCHGATLSGGANTTPTWTAVDGSQAFCGSCHGIPPLAPHPASYECATCHPDTISATGGIDVAGGKHINGEVNVVGSE